MQKGFSLLELIIAIGLASVVFIIVGSVLAVFVTQNTKNARQEMFEQAKNNVAVELANSVRWGQIVDHSLGTLTVDGVVYQVADGRLTKNTENILPENVAVTRFEVADYSARAGIAGLSISIEFEDRSYPVARDAMHLVVSQRVTDISF